MERVVMGNRSSHSSTEEPPRSRHPTAHKHVGRLTPSCVGPQPGRYMQIHRHARRKTRGSVPGRGFPPRQPGGDHRARAQECTWRPLRRQRGLLRHQTGCNCDVDVRRQVEAGGLSTSSLTTGQVPGRRSGTEHAGPSLIIGHLFLGLPVGVRATVSPRLSAWVELAGDQRRQKSLFL